MRKSIEMPPVASSGSNSIKWIKQYQVDQTVSSGSNSIKWIKQYQVDQTVSSGSNSIKWIKQYQVDQTVSSGSNSIKWIKQYQVDQTVSSGSNSIKWIKQYQVDQTVVKRLICSLVPTNKKKYSYVPIPDDVFVPLCPPWFGLCSPDINACDRRNSLCHPRAPNLPNNVWPAYTEATLSQKCLNGSPTSCTK